MDARLAEKFVAGSAAINQITNEINLVVKGILGLIDFRRLMDESQVSKFSDLHYDLSRGAGYYWHLNLYNNGKGGCEIEAYLTNYQDEIAKIVYSSDSGIFGSAHVQFVHKHLEDFVRGMIATFPELEQRLQPFFEAAEYFEKKA